MILTKKHILNGSDGRKFALDLRYDENMTSQPVIIFCHGFKGFKDWGHWNQIAHSFAEEGIAFLKFNFSHNGTSVESPIDFVDLEAFGQNNYSKELYDLRTVLDWLSSEAKKTKQLDDNNFILIGHSRGGPIALLAAQKEGRVKAAITWASVHDLDYAWSAPGIIDEWKKNGVYTVKNGRTGQNMPLYYQMYEDFESHRDALDVKSALLQSQKPLCVIHGSDDPAIPSKAAEVLHSYHSGSVLHLIDGADHVFGGKHPYEKSELPEHSKQLVKISKNFIGAL